MTPTITYFALRPVRVGDEIREQGDLVPEASEWGPRANSLVTQGILAPVLVETLTDESRDKVLDALTKPEETTEEEESK